MTIGVAADFGADGWACIAIAERLDDGTLYITAQTVEARSVDTPTDNQP